MTAQSRPHGASLGAATQRLKTALNALEAAVDRKLAEDVTVEALKSVTDAHADDRAQLAAQLDEARHRSERLEAANRDVSVRLDGAIDAIRGLLDNHRS